ncbi:MAG: efflux RND transporter periplasmic adaptor subunit [Akkermansiaceae bacterium]|nr:efflux RND transporter periplasmic adaptor subunit [Akkermansiaceae bacterium]
MKTFLTILLTALLAATATWFTLRETGHNAAATAPAGERKLLYYQSAMHPWIKSDKPGRCTICGMELTPVYEGDSGFDASGGGDIVALTQTQIQVLHVQTVEAKTRPLVRTLRVAGTINQDSTRHRVLSSYVDGRIDKLHLNFIGAEVAAGQPLAELYSPTLLQAEREYRQLTGELRKQTSLRLLQMGLTPAQIDALDTKPADALTSQILSPVSGTVVSQSVYEGQYVATGQQLFEIADFSTMWFMFRAYEQDLPWISKGLTVKVTTPSISNKSFVGKITFIDPNFEQATRSTSVRVELPNPLVNGGRELLNRLYADGLVELEAPSVLTLPHSAVIQTGPDAVVYIDKGGGAYEHHVVKTGRRGDTLTEILSGLSAGDQIVTNGNLLIDGQAEMNRAFMTPPETTAPVTATPATPAALDDEQKMADSDFLQLADTMSAALSADDLEKFNTVSAPSMNTTGTMVKLLKPLGANLDDLDHTRHFHGFDDIKSARIAFHKLSVAATAALEPLRSAGLTPEFQVYECGMVDEAIPGVPRKARWIQTGGRKLANPFFGAEMLECGEEIKP